MWAELLASWTEMKARASGLWHADRTKTRASVYETANVSETDTNAMKTTERGQFSNLQISQIGSLNKQMAHAFITSFSGKQLPSVVPHAVRRETGGPGVSSVHSSRLTHITRR